MPRNTPAQVIVVAGPQNAEGVFKSARMFHAAASRLERAHQEDMTRAPQGVSLDAGVLDHLAGTGAGAIVLEALALELVLKARLLRAGITADRTHNHTDLFNRLPEPERIAAEVAFQALLNIPMIRKTLSEILAFSSGAFEQWRYLHERPHVEASMGEMQRAFRALAQGMQQP